LLAGDHDQHIYSLNATITPWRRLNLSTTFSYHDTLTVSGVNGVAGVTPYGGDIYNVLSSANFIINNATDFNLSYAFSRADFRQERSPETLPLGIDYDRHGLIAGLSRRFGKRMIAHLQYGFFRYSEPSAGHARDYTAHGVFASWKMVFD
jgi:hypothetical protein